ncbi:helix-turn-helix domain-containing protein [Paenibacillus sp. MY03]|uniref:helix-turn-helix domain-containing protein n=1 Tax=Paenibacillus sp. MY03 TaxID=302980 RepID=UPI0015C67B8F|nr:helix-turn-helix transcriptional regulator [Paenibacillus sp. MY03]
MNKISILIGDKLRSLRQQQGLSQESLAFRAGITPTYLGQVERAEKSPTLETLEKIVSSLGISFEELFRLDSDLTNNVDYTIAQKIAIQLHGRSQEEQDSLYQIIKQLISFRDLK